MPSTSGYQCNLFDATYYPLQVLGRSHAQLSLSDSPVENLVGLQLMHAVEVDHVESSKTISGQLPEQFDGTISSPQNEQDYAVH